MSSPETVVDPEIAAIGIVYAGLKDLDSDAQQRVLDFVAGKLKLKVKGAAQDPKSLVAPQHDENLRQNKVATHDQDDFEDSDENDGISSTAKKWMKRNGLEPEKLSSIFSLGVDEIDLVAKSVPGKGKKERMHNVYLLKGVASYLGSGSPRFTYDQVKEALTHYDAFDSGKFFGFFQVICFRSVGEQRSWLYSDRARPRKCDNTAQRDRTVRTRFTGTCTEAHLFRASCPVDRAEAYSTSALSLVLSGNLVDH